MKRLIIVLIFMIASVGLFAQFKLVATTTIIADISKEIAGDHMEIISLMPVGGDPHLYDPIPKDAQTIVNASIIFKNGLGLEGWLNKLIDNSETSALIRNVSDGVNAIGNIEHENSYDPHAWMNVKNGIIFAENIYEGLRLIDPKNAKYYKLNLDDYILRLIELEAEVIKMISQIPINQRILITSHDAFRYYGEAYGIQVESIIGTSTEAEARIEDVNRIIQIIDNYKISSIFVESTINPKLMEQLSKDRGVRIGGKLFADSLDDPDKVAGTYIGMIRSNTETIVNGLLYSKKGERLNGDRLFLFVLVFLFMLTFFYVASKVRKKGQKRLTDNFKLCIEDLSTSYDQKRVLNNVNLIFDSGKIYGVVGPNGSGKSTLFKSILDLIPIDNGRVSINDMSINAFRDRVAYIPQKEEVDWSFPVTVMDLVLMGRYPHKGVFNFMQPEDKEIAIQALNKLDILHLKDQQIGELSGGQQQRAFIARALCQEADVYFMDEPFVGVDMLTEEKIISLLKDLGLQNKLVIIIHHDLSKVEEYFDEIVLMNRRIVASGRVQDVFIEENIKKTFSSQLPILQEKDQFINS